MSEPEPLPSEGPERKIFIEALRRMSRDCQAPALLAECPFSVDLPQGGRGCAEECDALLLAHDNAGNSNGGRAMPGIPGMSYQQRRPRGREPLLFEAEDVRAFDAGECYLRDRDEADRRLWSPAALVMEIRELLLTPPYGWTSDRIPRLIHCATELERRGVDPELLVRHGFGQMLVTHFAMAAAGVYLGEQRFPPDPDESGAGPLPQDVQDVMTGVGRGWAGLLEAHGIPNVFDREGDGEHSEITEDSAQDLELAERIRAALDTEFSRKIWQHVMSAPVEQLFSWEAPETLKPVLSPEVDREERRHYMWVADRFSETYEGDWQVDSLREEWRYMRGQENRSPFSRAVLDSRPSASTRIAEMLADRTCGDYGQDHISTGALKTEAVRFLRDGRRDAAVAVFEAAKLSDPDNPELVNNFGFCLLPDAPSTALAALEEAVRLGFPDNLLNGAMRVLAMRLLGRNAAALESAEQLLGSGEEECPEAGYLWEYDGAEGLHLGTQVCPRCYLAKLALAIAAEAGDPVLVERWGKRVVAISH